MKRTRKTILLLVALAGATLASAQDDILMKLSLDRDSILVGDQVDMTLQVSYSKSILFSFPTLGDTLMPGIEIVKTSKIDTLRNKKQEDRVNVQRKYTLTSFDGNIIYTLPKIMLTLNRGEAVDTFASNELTLKVALPPMDSTFTPNDVKPPVEYPITIAEAAPYVGGGILLLALIAFAVYYISRRSANRPLFFKPKPKEPAHIIALRALEKLKGEQLWQQGRVKEFHTRISEIIRVYIEDRYSIQAMEQTSEEILRDAELNNLCPKEHIDVLREVFYTSDLVKFAKFVPPPNENESCFQLTQQFIEKTKREQPVEPVNANNL
ncbi:MAG: hypothetical protein LBO71_02615 [Prevotellaceae bacterium]|jgi:hypothetical protein|nr:hypothetical protein [Prevotellaceae bacterium]